MSKLGDMARNAAAECELRASLVTDPAWKDLWLEMTESWRAVGLAQEKAEELFSKIEISHVD